MSDFITSYVNKLVEKRLQVPGKDVSAVVADAASHMAEANKHFGTHDPAPTKAQELAINLAIIDYTLGRIKHLSNK